MLECQKAYVCVREKAGVQIWRLGHKENEENKSCREKESVISKTMCPWQRSMEALGVFEKLRSQDLRDNDC